MTKKIKVTQGNIKVRLIQWKKYMTETKRNQSEHNKNSNKNVKMIKRNQTGIMQLKVQ